MTEPYHDPRPSQPDTRAQRRASVVARLRAERRLLRRRLVLLRQARDLLVREVRRLRGECASA